LSSHVAAPSSSVFFTLSLHDALPISFACGWSSEEEVAAEIRTRWERDGYLCDTHTAVAFHVAGQHKRAGVPMVVLSTASPFKFRSEEHTSELQSRFDLVCRLLLEKKK